MRRQLVTVSTVSIIAQLAGFFKLWLTARMFGVGAELDGYNLGLFLPTLIAGVIAGMLQTALFPVYAQIRSREDMPRLQRFERFLLVSMTLMTGTLALLLFLFADHIPNLIAPEATQEVRNWTAFVLPWTAALILLNGVGDYLSYILALRNRFVIAASAPIANALLSSSLLIAWPEGGLLNLTAGTVAGIALQVLICLLGAKFAGFRPWGSPIFTREFRAEIAQMINLCLWILPGMIFANLTATVPTVLIARFGDGAVSSFGYAYRLHLSVLQMLIMAASPVILAHFSDLVARKEWGSLRGLLNKAVLISFALGMLGWLGVYFLGEATLSFVFGYGRFDDEAVVRVTTQWIWLTIGLGPAILAVVLTKYLQALARPRLMSAMAGIGFIVLVVAALAFDNWLGAESISAALSLSAFLNVTILWTLLRPNSKQLN